MAQFDLSVIDRYSVNYRRSGTSIFVEVIDSLANTVVESKEFTGAIPGAPVPTELITFGRSRINAIIGAEISLGGGSSIVWRPITYFTKQANIDVDGVGTTNTVKTGLTRHTFKQPFRVVRRATRFRCTFSNGQLGTANTQFTLTPSVEVPTKNTSPKKVIPLTFGGQKSVIFPAGGGSVVTSDWMAYPLEAADVFFVNGDCYNGGSTFDLPVFGNTNVNSNNPSYSVFALGDGAIDNAATDNSQVLSFTAPWNTAHYSGGTYKCLMIETDCQEAVRLPTVDIWGDSLSQGSIGNIYSFTNAVCEQAGVAYANLAVQGSSQTQIPSRAPTRLNIARGDIAICQMGVNGLGSPSAMGLLWAYLRGLGYRKIIQTTIHNATNAGNTAVTSSATAINAYITSNLKVGNGPDIIWDFQGIMQDPITGLWRSSTYSSDGLHLTLAGEQYIQTQEVAFNWKNDLLS